MANLYTLSEVFTSGLQYDWLNLLSLGSILCGLFVIITKNPIVSVLFLIGLFLNIAIYLMMLGIHFIGISYLLVYVGAVSILFLFILMLINVRISELVTDNNNSIPLATMIGILFIFTLYNVFPKGPRSSFFSSQGEEISENVRQVVYLLSQKNSSFLDYHFLSFFREGYLQGQELYFATSNTWDGALAEFSHITTIGNILYTVYPLWLILTSLILLLAMVGAIVITLKQ